MNTIILVKVNSRGSGVPVGIPLGACAIATVVIKSKKVNRPVFFIMRCMFIILTSKASRRGGLFNDYRFISTIY